MSLLNDALRDLEKRERTTGAQQPVSPGLSPARATKLRAGGAAGRLLLGLVTVALIGGGLWWGLGKRPDSSPVTRQSVAPHPKPAPLQGPAPVAAGPASGVRADQRAKHPTHTTRIAVSHPTPEPQSKAKSAARVAQAGAEGHARPRRPSHPVRDRQKPSPVTGAAPPHLQRVALQAAPASKAMPGHHAPASPPKDSIDPGIRSATPRVAEAKPPSRSSESESSQADTQANTHVITPAPLSPAQRDQALAHRLSDLVQQGNADAAVGLLAARVAGGGDWQRSRQALVGALLAQKDYAPASRFLTPRVTRTYPALRLLKGRLLLATRGPAKALRYLQTDIPDIETWPQYHVTLATLLQQTGRSRQAAQVWSALLQIDNANAAWWAGLGIALDSNGNVQRARQAYRQALLLPGLNPALNQYVRQRLAQMPQS